MTDLSERDARLESRVTELRQSIDELRGELQRRRRSQQKTPVRFREWMRRGSLPLLIGAAVVVSSALYGYARWKKREGWKRRARAAYHPVERMLAS